MEVCVDCLASAINAEKGGASRIELCSALSEGGLTPSVGFLSVVKKIVKIPVFVMIRPRSGKDYNYCPDEVDIMRRDIIALKENGADGFVFGLLTAEREVDYKNCARLMAQTGGLPTTFHRAFDEVEKPIEALELIILLGFHRLLTSGKRKTARQGVPLIRQLIKAAEGRILIMPGGGIATGNLDYLLHHTGVAEFHGSAGVAHSLNITDVHNQKVEPACRITDEKIVRELVNIFDQYISSISKAVLTSSYSQLSKTNAVMSIPTDADVSHTITNKTVTEGHQEANSKSQEITPSM